MIVADASAVVLAVVDGSPRGIDLVAKLKASSPAVAPDHVDAEVGQSLRGLVLRGHLPADRAQLRLHVAMGLVSGRRPIRPLADRAWELRDNVSFYDGLYVALAERLGVSLLTADRRLAAANGPRCPVELV